MGQEAVARVTINRTKDPRFPNTICGVVYQKSQFSWTKEQVKRKFNKEAWDKATKIAYQVLVDEGRLNNFNAIYFHNKTVKPSWRREVTKVAKIGNHTFYN